MSQRVSSRWRAAVAATALVLVVGSLVGAGGATASPAPATRAPAQVRYDGEELLRGLFFGGGPVAQRYPSIARGHTDGTPASARLLGRLVDAVRAQDPAFFERFAADLYSGDRVAILYALQQASVLLQRGTARVLPEAERQAATDPAGKRTVVVAAASRFIQVDRNINIHVAVNRNVAVYINSMWVRTIPMSVQAPGVLDGELWVDAIATTLSPA